MSVTPEIILGPPGTGKTTKLISLVEEEMATGTPPDRIGYFSFTRRAAEEAISRACAKFNCKRDQFPYFRTLHSMCFRFLGLGSADVLEGKRLQEFAEYAGVRITGKWSEDGTLNGFANGDRMLFMENLARARRVTLREQYQLDDDQLPWNEVLRVSRALQEFKEDRGLMDYTDMLLQFVQMEARPRLDVLVVDEFQDLSRAQIDVVQQLAQGVRRFAVAGDDDQAIYRWAGADLDYFVTMQGAVQVLGQSWRVPRAVQEVANAPIGAVRKRRPKQWRPREEAGLVDRTSVFDDADCDGDSVLVLARNEYLLREQVEPALRREGIVYEKHGHPSLKQNTLEAIVTWEALRNGKSVTGQEARAVYNVMSAGTGYVRGNKTLPNVGDEELVSMEDLRQRGGLRASSVWHEALDRIPRDEIIYLRSARRRGEKLRKRPRVRISTIHGAKGGEADHVILMTEMAQRTHAEMLRSPEDEARVWYVGVTRARVRLTIVGSRTPRICPWL